MKNIILKFAAFSLAFSAVLAYAGNVSIGVTASGEVAPGVYGRVAIGDTPPVVVYPQPVTVIRQPQYVHAAPIYLHVPPGHAKNWRKHCRKYNACAQPVYFVRSGEYGESGNNKGKKHKHKHKHKHDH